MPTNIHAKEILLGMRFQMDLYANVRPVRLLDASLCPLKGVEPKDVDFVVVRENTEGVYTDAGGVFKKGTPDEVAMQEDINTRKGVERIIRYAFEYCERHKKLDGNPRQRVLMCDKSNAMTHAGGLWQRVFKEVSSEYPQIKAEHMYVDALCMQMVRDPRQFDIIVTNNMFGDIITDLAAGLQGGLGMAASGNIHPGADVDVRAGARFGAADRGEKHCESVGSDSDIGNDAESSWLDRGSGENRGSGAGGGEAEEDYGGHRRQPGDSRSRRVGGEAGEQMKSWMGEGVEVSNPRSDLTRVNRRIGLGLFSLFSVLILSFALWAQGSQGAAPPSAPQEKSGQSVGVEAGGPQGHKGAETEHKISPEEAKELFRSVDDILSFASKDTSLPIHESVKRRLTSRDEVVAYIEKHMAEDEDAQRLRRSERVLKKFGMLPRDFDLQKFLIALLREQVAGYYDPKTKTVNLLDWIDGEQQKPVLAHELTHALQDQSFGLEKWMKAGDTDLSKVEHITAADLEADEAIEARRQSWKGKRWSCSSTIHWRRRARLCLIHRRSSRRLKRACWWVQPIPSSSRTLHFHEGIAYFSLSLRPGL